MNRVLVIGSGGAGKSTTARSLHEITGLPLIHLDSYYWKPDWIESTKTEWEEQIQLLCKDPQWIMDGNYGGTMDYRLQMADTVFFLHIPRVICLFSALRRHFLRNRIDEIPGCPERIDLPFISWIWSYNSTRAPKILQKLKSFENKTIYIINNRKQLEQIFKQIKKRKNNDTE